ncbi:MAG: ATP synthase F0 subunit A [Bdellovibrionales bacterium RBG_16_40_8]|nr:MAG: ATP synthase F0 subunit A [Bdellovibrionales bacterium RBG_16_40_8]
MVHFNWTQLIPSVGHHYIHVATLILSVILLIILGLWARMALGTGQAAVTPAKTFGMKAMFEALVDFIVSIADMVIGEEGRKYVPMFASIFLFIFINNLLGLVPGMTPATDNINTTLALGIFVFVMYNYTGLREHGISYLKQFLGPLLLLAPLMVIIELISHFVRPMSLGLRLQGNMMGDHTVLGLFLNIAPYYGIPVIFYGLGLFVCFMQAFVFTMLSMIYVSMAISHDH